MAQAIQCDVCEQVRADMLLSNLNDGQTVGLCVGCAPTFLSGLAASIAASLPPADDPEADTSEQPHETAVREANEALAAAEDAETAEEAPADLPFSDGTEPPAETEEEAPAAGKQSGDSSSYAG